MEKLKAVLLLNDKLSISTFIFTFVFVFSSISYVIPRSSLF